MAQFCLEKIEQHYFSWQTWANFGDEGEKPILKKYHFQTLNTGKEIAIAEHDMYVTAFTLSHSAPIRKHSIFTTERQQLCIVPWRYRSRYIEGSTQLHQLWKKVSPLINEKTIKGIFIEVSYPNKQPSKSLFGHLTPLC